MQYENEKNLLTSWKELIFQRGRLEVLYIKEGKTKLETGREAADNKDKAVQCGAVRCGRVRD